MMRTDYLLAPEIHCSSCVMLLEGLEDDLEGVESVRVNLIKRSIEVGYDDDLITLAQIQKKMKELGYDTEILPATKERDTGKNG